MTRERIEDFREVVLPFVRSVLLKTNYERLGKSDAEEFTRDFNEILDLAIKALEQEPFINKPCVSSGVCEHDKNKVLGKIRAEIEKLQPNLRPEQMTDYDYAMVDVVNDIVAIIDKYRAETEV